MDYIIFIPTLKGVSGLLEFTFFEEICVKFGYFSLKKDNIRNSISHWILM